MDLHIRSISKEYWDMYSKQTRQVAPYNFLTVETFFFLMIRQS